MCTVDCRQTDGDVPRPSSSSSRSCVRVCAASMTRPYRVQPYTPARVCCRCCTTTPGVTIHPCGRAASKMLMERAFIACSCKCLSVTPIRVKKVYIIGILIMFFPRIGVTDKYSSTELENLPRIFLIRAPCRSLMQVKSRSEDFRSTKIRGIHSSLCFSLTKIRCSKLLHGARIRNILGKILELRARIFIGDADSWKEHD
jgi:hypothetical protein